MVPSVGMESFCVKNRRNKTVGTTTLHFKDSTRDLSVPSRRKSLSIKLSYFTNSFPFLFLVPQSSLCCVPIGNLIKRWHFRLHRISCRPWFKCGPWVFSSRTSLLIEILSRSTFKSVGFVFYLVTLSFSHSNNTR